MQIHRLTEIVFALLRDERVTARALAERFEVSTRTIYRDIDILSGAGIPVYTDKGNGGGISIAEDYRLSNALLSESERQNVVTMLTAFHASINSGETAALLNKLSGIFKSDDHFIEVDFSDWQNDDGVQRTFDALRKCIVEKRVASVEYYNSNGQCRVRELEPLKLIFKHKNWYLYAFCRLRGENRLFKLARVRRIEVLSERFDRICTETDVARNLRWEGDCVDVAARISRKMKHLIYEYFPGQPIEKTPEGDFIVRSRMPLDEWVMGYFLSFGDMAEVLEPLWLREKLREIHRRAAEI